MQNAISFMWCVVVVILGSFLLTSALKADEQVHRAKMDRWRLQSPLLFEGR